MTKPLTLFEMLSHDAQALQDRISANIARSGAETWADVKIMQADTLALAERMKVMAADQADVVRADIIAAITNMEAAGKMVEIKAGEAVSDAEKDIKSANEALLDSAQKATHSLSQAVVELRIRMAKAIAPASL